MEVTITTPANSYAISLSVKKYHASLSTLPRPRPSSSCDKTSIATTAGESPHCARCLAISASATAVRNRVRDCARIHHPGRAVCTRGGLYADRRRNLRVAVKKRRAERSNSSAYSAERLRGPGRLRDWFGKARRGRGSIRLVGCWRAPRSANIHGNRCDPATSREGAGSPGTRYS